jgi:hypothetical protein
MKTSDNGSLSKGKGLCSTVLATFENSPSKTYTLDSCAEVHPNLYVGQLFAKFSKIYRQAQVINALGYRLVKTLTSSTGIQ